MINICLELQHTAHSHKRPEFIADPAKTA